MPSFFLSSLIWFFVFNFFILDLLAFISNYYSLFFIGFAIGLLCKIIDFAIIGLLFCYVYNIRCRGCSLNSLFIIIFELDMLVSSTCMILFFSNHKH